MTTETHEPVEESLGQFLQRTRIANGYDLQQLVEETKISNSNLQAMEEDNYSSLPADAFCRGFYILYARALDLDPEKIVARYRAERGMNPHKGQVIAHNPPAHKAAQQVGNMAMPSAVSPLSTIGYVLLMLIILIGGVCWYFNINPATYLSEKLRGFQGEQTLPVAPPQDDGSTSRGENVTPSVESKYIGKLALESVRCRHIPVFLDKSNLHLVV